MTIAFYADYIAELKALFSELDRHPERFQTFDIRVELAAAGNIVVYETRRAKGRTDSLYYGRSASGTNRQISQATAFLAIDRFFGFGQFIALDGNAESEAESALDSRYPHCAVNFSFRRKGHPAARSMLMVFIGFNDDADALDFVSQNGDAGVVTQRPFATAQSWEWK